MTAPTTTAPAAEPWWFEDDATYEKFAAKFQADPRFAPAKPAAPAEDVGPQDNMSKLVNMLTKAIDAKAAPTAPATPAPAAPAAPAPATTTEKTWKHKLWGVD